MMLGKLAAIRALPHHRANYVLHQRRIPAGATDHFCTKFAGRALNARRGIQRYLERRTAATSALEH